MPNRVLKESICTSASIDSVSPLAETLFYRLLTASDDFGRFDGRPEVLRSKCFPLRIDRMPNRKVSALLEELENAGLVKIYESNGVRYGFFPKWQKHQRIRNQKSKYPDPLSIAVNCQQLAAKCGPIQSNPIQSNPVVGGGETFKSLPPPLDIAKRKRELKEQARSLGVTS